MALLHCVKKLVALISFAVIGVLTTPAYAQAPAYMQTVVADNVEVTYVRGELRFCERENLKGITCGFQQRLFGKTTFAARDWWSPETYVQARTGLNEFTLYGVAPTPDGRGLIIHFSR